VVVFSLLSMAISKPATGKSTNATACAGCGGTLSTLRTTNVTSSDMKTLFLVTEGPPSGPLMNAGSVLAVTLSSLQPVAISPNLRMPGLFRVWTHTVRVADEISAAVVPGGRFERSN
jgi:hypothetical protein